MDLKDIKAIIDLMKKNDLAEFQMEKEGFKIRIKRGADGYMPSMVRTERNLWDQTSLRPTVMVLERVTKAGCWILDAVVSRHSYLNA